MTFSISSYLHEHGPSRSATIVAALKKEGVSAAAARQRVSRAKPPVYSFPLGLLPKGEFFLYLQDLSIGVQKGPPIGVQKGPPSSSCVTGMAGVPFALVAA